MRPNDAFAKRRLLLFICAIYSYACLLAIKWKNSSHATHIKNRTKKIEFRIIFCFLYFVFFLRSFLFHFLFHSLHFVSFVKWKVLKRNSSVLFAQKNNKSFFGQLIKSDHHEPRVQPEDKRWWWWCPMKLHENRYKCRAKLKLYILIRKMFHFYFSLYSNETNEYFVSSRSVRKKKFYLQFFVCPKPNEIETCAKHFAKDETH